MHCMRTLRIPLDPVTEECVRAMLLLIPVQFTAQRHLALRTRISVINYTNQDYL